MKHKSSIIVFGMFAGLASCTVRNESGHTFQKVASTEFSGVECYAVVSCDEWVAVGCSDGKLRLWKWTAPQEVRVLDHGSAPIVDIARGGGDGKTLATIDATGDVKVWTNAEGKPVAFRAHKGGGSLAFLPTRDRLVTTGSDGGVRLWNSSSGTLIAERKSAHGSEINSVHVRRTKDGTVIATAAIDGSLKSWSANLEQLSESRSRVNGECLYVLADGRIVAGWRPRHVGVLSGTDNKLDLRIWVGANVLDVECPNDSVALSVDTNGMLLAHRVDNGRRVAVSRAHSGWAMAVTVSRDGRYAMTCGRDGKVCVWSLEK